MCVCVCVCVCVPPVICRTFSPIDESFPPCGISCRFRFPPLICGSYFPTDEIFPCEFVSVSFSSGILTPLVFFAEFLQSVRRRHRLSGDLVGLWTMTRPQQRLALAWVRMTLFCPPLPPTRFSPTECTTVTHPSGPLFQAVHRMQAAATIRRPLDRNIWLYVHRNH